jgi:hypothetical protein
MDQAHDSDEPKADESHFGTQISYILAGLAAVWLVSMGLMSIHSLVVYCLSLGVYILTIDKLFESEKTSHGSAKGY